MVKLTASRFESGRLVSLKDVRYVLGALHRDHSLSGLFILFERRESFVQTAILRTKVRTKNGLQRRKDCIPISTTSEEKYL